MLVYYRGCTRPHRIGTGYSCGGTFVLLWVRFVFAFVFAMALRQVPFLRDVCVAWLVRVADDG